MIVYSERTQSQECFSCRLMRLFRRRQRLECCCKQCGYAPDLQPFWEPATGQHISKCTAFKVRFDTSQGLEKSKRPGYLCEAIDT